MRHPHPSGRGQRFDAGPGERPSVTGSVGCDEIAWSRCDTCATSLASQAEGVDGDVTAGPSGSQHRRRPGQRGPGIATKGSPMPSTALNPARTRDVVRQSGRRAHRRAHRRLVAIGAAVAIAVAVALTAGSTASAGPADELTNGLTDAASTVGAGSYTTNPVGPLPGGCGTVSTNPRQFLTARAPTGAIPTNDWWSSLVFKRLNCQYSENLEANPLSFLPNANGLGFSYSTTAQLLAPAPGLQEYHYPYAQDFTAGVGGAERAVHLHRRHRGWRADHCHFPHSSVAECRRVGGFHRQRA